MYGEFKCIFRVLIYNLSCHISFELKALVK